MKRIVLQCFLILIPVLAYAQEYNAYDSEGKRHGKWKKRYENTDQIRYEGTFEHGKEVGKFKFYKLNSSTYPTAIKIFSKNNDTVKIQYFTQKGNIISQGQMVDKNRIGLWKYFHKESDTIMMTEYYKLGKLNGKQSTYFKNGQLTESVSYIDGKREGERMIYSEAGVVIKRFMYENDQLHGPTKYYDTEGNLMIEGNYKRDRKDGVWKYYKNGKLDEEKEFPLYKKKNQ